MNRLIFLFCIILSLNSCSNLAQGSFIKVTNKGELTKAISDAKPGDEIVLADGVWSDVQIQFSGHGTKDKPIIIRAETEGKVSIEGKSNLRFGGEYLTVSGLHFKNGFSPSSAVVLFRIDEKQVANHCRFTNCVIEDFNQLKRDKADHWVEFWGRHNQLDHCYIAGKSNKGPTVRVQLKGNESINNYHQIVSNHFGPRPDKGGPQGETIQLGDSETSMSPSHMMVANNLFERCNGEVEIISNKSNFNEFRSNIFYKCEGSLVLRHGNYCIVDANIFIGDSNSEHMGGVRVINTGHWITNNYFYNLKGKEFRSPLAVMNGIPKSPLNRYNQVTDVVIAHNTWVNCLSPWQFGVGTNVSQKDVLPESEIRSARPIRTIVANNIIYNEAGNKMPVIAHDKIDGILFKNNVINKFDQQSDRMDGLDVFNFGMTKLNDYIFVPDSKIKDAPLYNGFEFETIQKDLFGTLRGDKNIIGAISGERIKDPMILDKTKYGVSWFSNEKPLNKPAIILLSDKTVDLNASLSTAKSGDIIELTAGVYNIEHSLVINKEITIRSKDTSNRAQIVYSGAKDTPAFEMQPKGNLTLENIILTGKNEQYAFACSKENMSSLYNLSVQGCEIFNFNYVLRAYKESFSDLILFSNTSIKNCANGIDLSAETGDHGDYNVEYLTIDHCQFDNIKSNVINYYRGGYDESTIGGNLLVTHSAFTNCGKSDTSGILISSTGIINVDISKNVFKNNGVKMVALLWGAKNNSHSENEIINSGKIVVEENLKLKLLY
ncbi:MAG: chondroitinase-B domain-containing protein [Saprospiraceae bacterium]